MFSIKFGELIMKFGGICLKGSQGQKKRKNVNQNLSKRPPLNDEGVRVAVRGKGRGNRCKKLKGHQPWGEGCQS